MIRTTVDSGSFVYSISEPCLSLKRVPQLLQYNRRMALSAAGGLIFAHPFGDGQIAGVEAIEVMAVLVRTGEEG